MPTTLTRKPVRHAPFQVRLINHVGLRTALRAAHATPNGNETERSATRCTSVPLIAALSSRVTYVPGERLAELSSKITPVPGSPRSGWLPNPESRRPVTQAAVGVSLNQRVLVVDRGSFGGKTCILPPLSWLPERDAGAVSIETAKTVNALADVLAARR